MKYDPLSRDPHMSDNTDGRIIDEQQQHPLQEIASKILDLVSGN